MSTGSGSFFRTHNHSSMRYNGPYYTLSNNFSPLHPALSCHLNLRSYSTYYQNDERAQKSILKKKIAELSFSDTLLWKAIKNVERLVEYHVCKFTSDFCFGANHIHQNMLDMHLGKLKVVLPILFFHCISTSFIGRYRFNVPVLSLDYLIRGLSQVTGWYRSKFLLVEFIGLYPARPFLHLWDLGLSTLLQFLPVDILTRKLPSFLSFSSGIKTPAEAVFGIFWAPVVEECVNRLSYYQVSKFVWDLIVPKEMVKSDSCESHDEKSIVDSTMTQRNLMNRYSPWLVASSIAFGLCHVTNHIPPYESGMIDSWLAGTPEDKKLDAFYRAISQSIGAMLLGFNTLGPFYESRGLGAAIGAHMAWNAMIITLPFRLCNRILFWTKTRTQMWVESRRNGLVQPIDVEAACVGTESKDHELPMEAEELRGPTIY